MINIYKTIDGKIVEIDEIEKHAWINMVDPTEEEIQSISTQLDVEEDFLRAALDEEELSRVEFDEDMNHALITIDVPIVDKDSKMVL
ncbi:MAG: magnesium transporter CorA family protein, partial [Eubacterium sp.]